jgi:hypothetical protein
MTLNPAPAATPPSQREVRPVAARISLGDVSVLIPLGVVALLVALAPFLLHAVAAFGSYFWQDDFIITFRAAQGSPLDPGYVFQPYNGEHLAPGMFVLAWLVTAVAPLSYPIAVLPVLLMQALMAWLFWRLLVDCFGRRWGLLLPYAAFTFSPLILLPILWWAYALQLVPLLLAMIGALGAQVRYVRTGARRYAVYTLLWTIAGLAFYLKAALIPVLLLAVTMLVTPPGTLSTIGTVLRRYTPLWLAHAGLLIAFVAVYLTATTTTVEAGGDRSGITELLRRMFLDTFLPGMFGGTLGGSAGGVTWAQPPAAMRILAAALAVVIVVAGLVRGKGRAALAWLVLAGYLAVDLALLVAIRLPLVGAIVGTDPRYVADAVPIAVLCATFCFLTPRGEPLPEPETEARSEVEPEVGSEPASGRSPRLVGIAVAVLVVAFMVNAVVSHVTQAPDAQSKPAREYVANAARALAADPDMVLYDGTVPNDVILDWFLLDAKPSRVVSLLPERPRFDQPTERLHMLDQTGTPRPVSGVAYAVPGVPGTAKDCGHLVTDAPTAIRLTDSVLGRHVARLEYYTGDSGKGFVNVGDNVFAVDFERGAHVLFVPAEGLFDTLTLRRATNVAPVCVTKVQVGEPVV